MKLRLPLSLAGFALLVTQIDPRWFPYGLAVSILGSALQLWCFACIKTRKVLALRGPYMFVRNPMYLSRFFAILGILMMTGFLWLVGFYLPVYYLYMLNRVKREEPKLREAFGADYEAYCDDVYRFWPTFRRFDRKSLWGGDWENFQRNHGLINLATMTALWILCLVFAYWV